MLCAVVRGSSPKSASSRSRAPAFGGSPPPAFGDSQRHWRDRRVHARLADGRSRRKVYPMPILKNSRRELFAQNVIKGARNGWSQAEVYLRSGYKARGHAAEVAASRLLKFDEVRMRVDELMRPAIRKSRITIESLLAELETTIADARKAKQHSVVVRSLELAARLAGLLREKIEVGSPDEFAACATKEQVVDKLIADAGSPAVLIDELHEIIIMIEERAATMALDVKPKRNARLSAHSL